MTVVHAMLGNAAVAAVLALFALAVGFAVRSPVVRHAAWVLVLLKLVTPPLFTVPLPVLPAAWAEQPAEPSSATLTVQLASATDTTPSLAAAVVPTPTWWERYRPRGGVEWAIVVWVIGTVGWFVWQGRRIARFRRRVRSGESAPPDVADAASRLAAALGIARAPAVKIAAGIASPMLWGWGRKAVVLFPRELLARLSPEARDTLLAHELAHFLRRDHWVRVLEFVATGLFWWHPAIWIARQGIEAAEEECCDAWVVGGLAASPRRYAEALLATVDFEAELRRPCLPPGACAANRSARLLRRRLFGIIHAGPPQRLRGRFVLGPLVIGVLLTRPVLRAASPDPAEPSADSVASAVQRPPSASPPPPPPRRLTEPRAWATATSPAGGPTVVARDREVILRHPDGTTATLGPGRPLAVSFAPGGRRLATVGPGPLVRTWDHHGALLAEARVPAAARSIAYTADGSRLLVLDAASGITVLDPQTLATVATWAVEGPANSIACSPDGHTVAVSFGSWREETGWVESWSIPERRKLGSYPASGPVGATRFAPDGQTLVIGSWNGTVTWRALPGGELIAERHLTKDVVATTAFCPEAGTLPPVPPPEAAPPPSPILPGIEDLVPKISQFPQR